MANFRPRTKHPRGEQLRSIGATLGETAELLGSAEARLASSVGEVAGEATRVVGRALSRTSVELGIGDSDLIEEASDAVARSAEATSTFASDVLASSGAWARAMTSAATEVVADAVQSRDVERANDAASTDMPPVPGPS
jgi:hypothetical protein